MINYNVIIFQKYKYFKKNKIKNNKVQYRFILIILLDLLHDKS